MTSSTAEAIQNIDFALQLMNLNSNGLMPSLGDGRDILTTDQTCYDVTVLMKDLRKLI